jgi:hypothetical protein
MRTDIQGLLKLIKIPKYRQNATKDARTPRASIVKSFVTIPDSEWQDPTRYWADFAVGRGSIALELIAKLRQYHDDAWIIDHLWVLDIDLEVLYSTRKFMERELGTSKLNIIHADFLTWLPPSGMKFNIVMNGPWNITAKPTNNGTGGDSNTWKKFYDCGLKLLDMYFIMWAPKGGFIKMLRQQTDNEVVAIDLMTDEQYWNKNACVATIKNTRKITIDLDTVVADKCPIIKCISIMGDNPNWNELNGERNATATNYTKKDAVRAIVQLPNGRKKLPLTYGNVNPTYSGLVPYGPKFISTLLESATAQQVTMEPTAASSQAVYSTSRYGDSLENAKKIQLFVNNNPLLRAIHKRLKTKGPTWTMRHVRDFDPSQLENGTEIPKEWGLSPDEVSMLLNNTLDHTSVSIV